MVKDAWRIVWTKRSQQHMRQIFEYISADSAKNAAKVIDEIIDAVFKAVDNPKIYAPDKYKLDNDGSFRAFEKNHYRVSYRAANNIIRVLWVQHTSRRPRMH